MTSGVAPQPATVYRLTDKNDIEAITSVQCDPIPNFHNSHNLKKFTKELEKYMNRYKKQQPQKKAKLEFAFIPSTAFISQEVIFTALRRCLTSEKYWSESAMFTLLENKHIMAGYQDDVVFQCITKYKCFTLLKLIRETFHVVADRHVVRVLSAVLHNIASTESAALQNAQKYRYYSDCPVSEGALVDLTNALTLPVNKATLRDSLKALTLEEALLALQCLVYMMHVVSPALAPNKEKSSRFDAGMTEKRVVVWMDMLLTAHLMGLVTSPSFHTLIPDIMICVQKQLTYYKEIGGLAAMLKRAMSGRVARAPLGNYVIQTISL